MLELLCSSFFLVKEKRNHHHIGCCSRDPSTHIQLDVRVGKVNHWLPLANISKGLCWKKSKDVGLACGGWHFVVGSWWVPNICISTCGHGLISIEISKPQLSTCEEDCKYYKYSNHLRQFHWSFIGDEDLRLLQDPSWRYYLNEYSEKEGYAIKIYIWFSY